MVSAGNPGAKLLADTPKNPPCKPYKPSGATSMSGKLERIAGNTTIESIEAQKLEPNSLNL